MFEWESTREMVELWSNLTCAQSREYKRKIYAFARRLTSNQCALIIITYRGQLSKKNAKHSQRISHRFDYIY